MSDGIVFHKTFEGVSHPPLQLTGADIYIAHKQRQKIGKVGFSFVHLPTLPLSCI